MGDSNATVLESLLVKLQGDASGLITEWKRADSEGQAIINKMGANLTNQVAAGFLKAQVAMALFTQGLRFLKELTIDAVKNQLDHIASQTRLADRLGITTEALEVLGASASKAGISQDQLTGSVQKMSRALAEAGDETSKPARAIRELGLSVADLQELSPDKQFAEIAEAMSHLRDQSEKTRLAVELFGRGAYDIIGVLNAGKAGLESSAHSVEGFGLALDRVDAQKVLDANKAMHEFDKVIKGISVQLTAVLAPYLTVVTQHIADIARESGGFRVQIESAVKSGVTGLGVLADATRILELAWKRFKVAVLVVEQAAVDTFVAFGSWLQRTIEDVKLGTTAMVATFGILWAEIKLGLKAVVVGFESMIEGAENILIAGVEKIANVAGIVSADLAAAIRSTTADMAEHNRKASEETTKYWQDAKDGVRDAAADAGKAWDAVFDPNRDSGENTDPRVLRWKQAVDDAVVNAKTEFNVLWASAKPSETLMDGLNRALAEVQKKAEEAVRTIKGGTGNGDADAGYAQAAEAGRQQGLKNLSESLNEELLLENEKYQKEVENAQEQFDRLKASKVTQDAVMAQLAGQHAARLKGINAEAVQSERILWETSWKGKLSIAGEYLGVLASLQNSKNREMFEIGKASAEANAVITTAAGVAKTFEQLGYYALFGPAEAVALAGLAQIQTIRSASFNGGGGGTAAVPGGGTATVTTPAPTQTPGGGQDLRGTGQNIVLNLGDDDTLTTVGAFRKLITKLNKAIGAGAKIQVQ